MKVMQLDMFSWVLLGCSFIFDLQVLLLVGLRMVLLDYLLVLLVFRFQRMVMFFIGLFLLVFLQLLQIGFGFLFECRMLIILLVSVLLGVWVILMIDFILLVLLLMVFQWLVVLLVVCVESVVRYSGNVSSRVLKVLCMVFFQGLFWYDVGMG